MEPLQIGGRTYTLQLAPNPVLPTADIIADLVVDFLTDFNTRRHPEQEAIWDKYRETILYDCEILAAPTQAHGKNHPRMAVPARRRRRRMSIELQQETDAPSLGLEEREAALLAERSGWLFRPSASLLNDPDLTPPIPFGLPEIDTALGGGLRAGLHLLVGFQHNGKTQLLLRLLHENRDKPMILFSPDEDAEQVMFKLISLVTETPLTEILGMSASWKTRDHHRLVPPPRHRRREEIQVRHDYLHPRGRTVLATESEDVRIRLHGVFGQQPRRRLRRVHAEGGERSQKTWPETPASPG